MAAKKSAQRKPDISFLNLFFCFLVVLIHVSSEVVTKMDHGRSLYWAIATISKLSGFAVYGFILLSGVKLFLKAEHLHYGRFYLSRLVSILLPYVVWVVLYYLYFCAVDTYRFSWRELGGFLLSGGLSAQFYFIVVLMQFYLLMPLWMLWFKRGNPAVILPICLMLSLLGGNALTEFLAAAFPNLSLPPMQLLFPRYLFFWAAGCMIGLHYSVFQEYLHRRWLPITLLFGLLLLANGGCTLFYRQSALVWTEEVNLLYAISAILFFYMLAQVFTKRGAVLLRPFRALDRATYGIYLIHCLLIVMTGDLLDTLGVSDLMVRYGYRALAAYLGSGLLCLLWQMTVKGYRESRKNF